VVEEAFLDAITSEPDEDAPRLAYAEWLEENGRLDRAEFIRLQCEAAKLPPGSPGRLCREARARELLAVHEAVWVEPLLSITGVEWEFSRGFAVASRLSLGDYCRHRDGLRRLSAVLSIDCEIWGGLDMDVLAGFPALPPVPHRLTGLTVHAAPWREVLHIVAGCPHLVSLTRLDLSNNQIRACDVATLAESRCLSRLVELDLRGNYLCYSDCRPLLAALQLPCLMALQVEDDDAGLTVIEAAVASVCTLLAEGRPWAPGDRIALGSGLRDACRSVVDVASPLFALCFAHPEQSVRELAADLVNEHCDRAGLNAAQRCPVCGSYLGNYALTNREGNGPGPVWSYNICECCTVEFGCNGRGVTIDDQQDLCKGWLTNGGLFGWDGTGVNRSFAEQRPPDWCLEAQLQVLLGKYGPRKRPEHTNIDKV
jgi:uncharacterized protein (TIGR02996 family)